MIRWLNGECREVLRGLDAASVHCVVTSPPYWGLREYGNGAGGIGLEPTLGEWVQNIVDVMNEVWRVLRDDGTVWLNLGDAYAGSGSPGGDYRDGRKGIEYLRPCPKPTNGLKPKDLMGQPWRVAFALQDAGWYLRSDIIWHKPNPLPESVQDRPTKAHEYLFLLTKRPRYYYDGDAVREAHSEPWRSNGMREKNNWSMMGKRGSKDGVRQYHPGGRNRRSVWTIATQPFSAAHFATFPPALVEPCILAGTSAHGVCGDCGAPWVRGVKRFGKAFSATKFDDSMQGGPMSRSRQAYRVHGLEAPPVPITTGWHPSCSCDASVVPATVLDPFGGAGTTALVVDRLGRDAISIELNPEYHAMAQARVLDEAPLLHHTPDEPDEWARMEQLGLFGGE